MTGQANRCGVSSDPAIGTAPTKIVPIRPRMRKHARENRLEDDGTIGKRDLIRFCFEKLETEQDTNERETLARLIAVAEGRLPSSNLRCIFSTLDERRDFDLRCTEVEILKAQHTLDSLRIDRLRTIEGIPHWDSDVTGPMVRENNELWETYRERLLDMAHTPARTRAEAERKVRIIGKFWLKCDGDYYARLRAGVAADEAWLAENAPKKGRR